MSIINQLTDAWSLDTADDVVECKTCFLWWHPHLDHCAILVSVNILMTINLVVLSTFIYIQLIMTTLAALLILWRACCYMTSQNPLECPSIFSTWHELFLEIDPALECRKLVRNIRNEIKKTINMIPTTIMYPTQGLQIREYVNVTRRRPLSNSSLVRHMWGPKTTNLAPKLIISLTIDQSFSGSGAYSGYLRN